MPQVASIVDGAVCPAVATDRYNRVVSWNAAFTDLAGFGNYSGSNLQDLLQCRHSNGNLLSHSHVALHEMVLSGEAPAAFEIDIEPEDRPRTRAEVSIVVVIDTDPTNHWLVYLLRPRLRRRQLDVAMERLLGGDAPPPRRNSRNAAPTLLTRRQLQVLEIMATGATATEIAAELEITPNTVRTHIRAIFEALGVTRQTEAVARAVRQHLI
jgi:DNA-binding CsgD family transcriptional regulator